GQADAPQPGEPIAGVPVVVEAEPFSNEAHDSLPRRELDDRLERAQRLDDARELVDVEPARIASRPLVVRDQLAELAECGDRQVLCARRYQRFAPDAIVELRGELRADVAEPSGRRVAAGRGELVQRVRACLERRKHAVRLVVRAGGAARRNEQHGGESCEPSRHVSKAAMRAAISSPSCRSFASAYSATSSAYSSGISAAVAMGRTIASTYQGKRTCPSTTRLSPWNA